MQSTKAVLLAALLMISGTATSVELVLCVRGQSFQPDREFLQTRQVKVTFDGPAPGDLIKVLSAAAVQEKLWPGIADDVQVELFDEALCGNEPIALVTLPYRSEDLAAIKVESERGDNLKAKQLVNALAAGSSATPAPPKVAPQGAPEGALRHDWFELYVATTRNLTGATKAPEAFGKKPAELIFGRVEVSIPFDHRWARLESPSIVRLDWDANRSRHILLGPQWDRKDLATWQGELLRRAGKFNKPGVLLFVHGYNNNFAQSAERAAQLAHDLSFPGPTVLFSWPSDGDLFGYLHDEDMTRTAWRQMATVLDALTRLGPGVPVFVVAHSMGNRVLTEGMANLLQQRPGADRAFKQIVLASPDIGRGEFSDRWVNELASVSRPRYTMYASAQDLPVALSAWLHEQPRLGSGGPGIAVISGLDSIDASAVTKEWFGLNHSYFGDSDTVLSDLFTLIHNDIPPPRARLKKVRGENGEYWEFAK